MKLTRIMGLLLQVYPNSTALVVSTENITQNWYFGEERSMLIPNCLFRIGGAAMVLSNRFVQCDVQQRYDASIVDITKDETCIGDLAKCGMAVDSHEADEHAHDVVSNLPHRRRDRWTAKYELLHTVRTHMGASDANFGCVVQREDAAGKVRCRSGCRGCALGNAGRVPCCTAAIRPTCPVSQK